MEYVLQAAIASLHAEVPCDWAQLARLTGSPVVELNRAIAVAETEGPAAGLRLVDQLGLDEAWGRWPSAGPTDAFGSAEAYRQTVQLMVSTGTLPGCPANIRRLRYGSPMCACTPTTPR